jgi:hypothetical protein
MRALYDILMHGTPPLHSYEYKLNSAFTTISYAKINAIHTHTQFTAGHPRLFAHRLAG